LTRRAAPSNGTALEHRSATLQGAASSRSSDSTLCLNAQPRHPTLNFRWDNIAADLHGSNEARHVIDLAPPGNWFAAFHRGPHVFACQVGDVSHRMLVGVTASGKVPKVGNASNEPAIALDHRLERRAYMAQMSPMALQSASIVLAPRGWHRNRRIRTPARWFCWHRRGPLQV
jgi:hypothetical protein